VDPAIGPDEAQDDDLLEHGNVVFSHPAVQRVEQMMARAVCGVAGAGDLGAAEGTLGYAAVGGACSQRVAAAVWSARKSLPLIVS
jgi:hypothetical protein